MSDDPDFIPIYPDACAIVGGSQADLCGHLLSRREGWSLTGSTASNPWVRAFDAKLVAMLNASDNGGRVMGKALAKLPTLSELATDINENHELALMYVGQSFDHAVKAGLLLIEAKAQVQHGKWLAWLKANVKVSARQAQNYMKVASCPEQKRNAVADLSLRKAIHELALHKVQDGDRVPAAALLRPRTMTPTRTALRWRFGAPPPPPRTETSGLGQAVVLPNPTATTTSIRPPKRRRSDYDGDKKRRLLSAGGQKRRRCSSLPRSMSRSSAWMMAVLSTTPPPRNGQRLERGQPSAQNQPRRCPRTGEARWPWMILPPNEGDDISATSRHVSTGARRLELKSKKNEPPSSGNCERLDN